MIFTVIEVKSFSEFYIERLIAMNVSLTPELEGFIGELVLSGDCFSASEVVRDGLRLLKEREALKDIRFEEPKREMASNQSIRGVLRQ